MALPNIFAYAVRQELIKRISMLTKATTPKWGKINVAQILAHLNVMFELAIEEEHKRPNALVRFLLRFLVKDKIINEVPYKKNSRTAPEMVIKDQPDFLTEKDEVLRNLKLVGKRNISFLSNKEHPSFGKLTVTEWSNLLYKHTDHHLKQFSS